MKVLGIIPARSGSKRLPNKNIKKLGDIPLIEYTYNAVLKSTLLDRTILSTDCEKILSTAKGYGHIETPFVRPKEFARDCSSDIDVIRHALNFMASIGESYDIVVYLRPTSPFKTGEIIDQVISNCLHRSAIRTVTKSVGVYHPFWMYRQEDGRLVDFCKEGGTKKYYQSQLLPECFRLNGVVDCLKTENIKNDELYGNNIGFLELEERHSVDIDTAFDFEFAEFLLPKMNL